MTSSLRIIFTCALALAVFAAGAATANASSRQVTIMQDDALLFRSGADVRDETLDEMAALGADVIKAQVYWNEISPRVRRKPAGFDSADPASYDFGVYDALVEAIVARGMTPYLVIGNRAPDWAVKKRTRSPHDGIYRPSSKEFRLFAQAVGRRYSGSYNGLPRVRLWAIWNEVNLSSWLAPQRSKKGVPIAPSLYRNLYLAGQKGLAATGHASDTILLGELMPLGAGSKSKFTPLDFLREMVCLDRAYRPYRGRAARARGCPRKVGRIRTSGIALHPYLPRAGLRAATRPGEVPITKLARLTSQLNLLGRRGKLPNRLPVWITEFGFQTDPPDPFQTRIGRVPGMMDQSEWIAFRNPRVRSYSQYTLRDEGLNPGGGFQRYARFQMGLRFASGKAKKGVYDAFRMPVFVRLLGSSRVEVFGGLRTGARAVARIESRRRGGRYRALGKARLSSTGYFRKVLSVGGANDRTYRVTISGHRRVKKPVTP
jgi:hypothetical protein